MANEKADVLLLGPAKPLIVNGLSTAFNVHKVTDPKDGGALISQVGPRLRGIAVAGPPGRIAWDWQF